jgi:hypothetical protein
MRLRGPQSQSGGGDKEKKLLPYLESNPDSLAHSSVTTLSYPGSERNCRESGRENAKWTELPVGQGWRAGFCDDAHQPSGPTHLTAFRWSLIISYSFQCHRSLDSQPLTQQEQDAFISWWEIVSAPPNPLTISTTVYSVCLQLPSICGSLLLHPQPEDEPCHGDKRHT